MRVFLNTLSPVFAVFQNTQFWVLCRKAERDDAPLNVFQKGQNQGVLEAFEADDVAI